VTVRRYRVHVETNTGPAAMVVHADTVTSDGDLLWFRNENRIVGSIPVGRLRMLLLDRVDIRVGGKPRSF
jgi:hypothetical protein